MISVIEKWRPIEGYENYLVSNFGEVKSLPNISNSNIRFIKQEKSNRGYYRVHLYKNGKGKHLSVHRLVAMTFIPNPHNLPQVNHKDENKQNNNVDNLEWVTNKQNINYGNRTEIARGKNINHPSHSKRVNQFTLGGEFVREWVSIAEAGRNGYNCQCICMCCNGKMNTHKNFVWKYAEE